MGDDTPPRDGPESHTRTAFPVVCDRCGGQAELLIVVDLTPIRQDLDEVKRILRSVVTKEGTIMTDVETLTADFNTYKGDVTAAFARLQASIDAAGGIPADVQAQIDALDVAIHGADDEANAEDPAAAPAA